MMRPGAAVKRFLPRSLLGRSILIILLPIIIIQLVSAWIFYDRHVETLTRRLATGIANEVGLLIEAIGQAEDPSSRAWVLDYVERTGTQAQLRPGERLPEVAAPASSMLDRILGNALAQRIGRPYLIDTEFEGRSVRIQVELAEGVLDVVVSRKRLVSVTTILVVLWMVGTSIVLFIVAAIFMRNQVLPIRRLAGAVDLFGKGRDVPRLRIEGASEVRLAATAFERMRERVHSALTQRTEMLAGVSHDLRTPLTRMKLELALLGDDVPGLAELRSDVVEMEKMVDEYLDFARGEGTEAVEPIDVARLVSDVGEQARRSGASVEVEANNDLVLSVRPNALRRSLTNIVSNAIRYADHTEIRATRNGESVEITIDDDGPGIPEAERTEVFKPFYRLDGSRNPETGGSGLGLAIARDIIVGHGGELTLDASPSGGLRALIRLPL